MTERERRVRQLIADAENHVRAEVGQWAAPFGQGGRESVRYVANRLLDEMDTLTKDANKAVKAAAKGKP